MCQYHISQYMLPVVWLSSFFALHLKFEIIIASWLEGVCHIHMWEYEVK